MTDAARHNPHLPIDDPPPTLATFLEARLAEDEAAANGADRLSAWKVGSGPSVKTEDGDRVANIAFDVEPRSRNPVAEHIARHDPARVLADGAAKRAIVARVPAVIRHDHDPEHPWLSCPKALDEPLGDLPWGPDAECTCGADSENAKGGNWFLRILAQPYADHPDFDPAWTVS